MCGGPVGYVRWGVRCLLIALGVANRRNLRVVLTVHTGMALKVSVGAIPGLLLVVIILGGIVRGIFPAIEASAISVVYTLLLTMVFYRTIQIKAFPSILIHPVVIPGFLLFMLSPPSAISLSLCNTRMPQV
ncbi:TRAP transporter large permease subunit, partial [Salmonella enterica]|uniref:TRAP transporter large permease subunit n=1 Tax=Salmonella enterica TaxID=28901 RepID=UPI00398C7234